MDIVITVNQGAPRPSGTLRIGRHTPVRWHQSPTGRFMVGARRAEDVDPSLPRLMALEVSQFQARQHHKGA